MGPWELPDRGRVVTEPEAPEIPDGCSAISQRNGHFVARLRGGARLLLDGRSGAGRLMADQLTPWEQLMVSMDLDDWLDQENCPCEGVCKCEEENE